MTRPGSKGVQLYVPLNMRSAGMIGGLGPESTVDYYRSVIARDRARKPDRGIINSFDVDRGIAVLAAGRVLDLADYLAAGVELLARAGAKFGFIAANTPHVVFDELRGRSAIPLLSIVRAASDYAKGLGLKKVGPVWNRIYDEGELLPRGTPARRIAVVRPKDSEQDVIHRSTVSTGRRQRWIGS